MSVTIKYNDEVIYTISDLQLTVAKSYINEDKLDQWLKDEISCRMRDRFAEASERFMKEWVTKLQADPTITSVPLAPADFIALVIARPDYKTKKQQDESPIL